jgi:hypothetical protein
MEDNDINKCNANQLFTSTILWIINNNKNRMHYDVTNILVVSLQHNRYFKRQKYLKLESMKLFNDTNVTLNLALEIKSLMWHTMITHYTSADVGEVHKCCKLIFTPS